MILIMSQKHLGRPEHDLGPGLLGFPVRSEEMVSGIGTS